MYTKALSFSFNSDNVRPGFKFARKYFDSIEKMVYRDYGQRLGLSAAQNIMNLHNNKAGRLVSFLSLEYEKSTHV